MLQTLKNFLWIVGLVLSFQSAWAFSLLGPLGVNGTTGGTAEDNWQVVDIGYNPLPAAPGPPFFSDSQPSGPKNYTEGYRLNTPVLYYTFDPSFGYFGSNGEFAVQQAFDTLNSAFTNSPTGMTNGMDGYSANLTEFPLNSESVNYQAQTLDLYDLKSWTLSLMMEQLALADSVRFTWGLLSRYTGAPGAICNSTPLQVNGVEYWVIQRNYDITASPLNQIQYSPYVNGELYSYFIDEDCGLAGASPPDADALEIPVDPLNDNPPVASGHGEDALPAGSFYTGLSRDDAAGLRYLMSSNNDFAASVDYLEPPASGSVVVSGGGGLTTTNLNDEFTLTTSNLTALFLASLTNNPTALQALYPGLVIASVITNFNGTFTYTFANIGTNIFTTNTPVQIQVQTISFAPPGYGSPYGSPSQLTTNTTTTTVLSNIVSGDFFLIPTNTCGLDIIQTLATNITAITNSSLAVTNIPNPTTTNIVSTNIVISSTNYTLLVAPCEFVNNSGGTNANIADYQGIEKAQFVRVSDANYDYQTGQFYQAVTNQYTMTFITKNGQIGTVTFQRVVTRPDFVFMGASLASGGGSAIAASSTFARGTPNFINSRAAAAGLAGPGIIDPTGSSSNIVVTFNTVGPIYANSAPAFIGGPGAAIDRSFIWGSFDGTTNAPVVYPNGTSIANLASEALVQISPTTLPDATNGVFYSVTFSATGGSSPYTWSLASNSAGLPSGLSLNSSSGVISGTPTESGTFDDIVIQMTDSSFPSPLSVQVNYSLTINE
jgi:hypothetical protein